MFGSNFQFDHRALFFIFTHKPNDFFCKTLTQFELENNFSLFRHDLEYFPKFLYRNFSIFPNK